MAIQVIETSRSNFHNIQDFRRNSTALQFAAQFGLQHIARRLIDSGIDINAVNSYRETTLQTAV